MGYRKLAQKFLQEGRKDEQEMRRRRIIKHDRELDRGEEILRTSITASLLIWCCEEEFEEKFKEKEEHQIQASQ